MKRSVYLESSILSYLTARPSRDLIAAARQELTLEWWQANHNRYRLFVSDLVISEIGRGNPEEALRRLELARRISVLEPSSEAQELAGTLVTRGFLPAKALADAAHIALTSVHKVDYLLTWNMRHIANATIRRKVATFLSASGFHSPIIATPEELVYEG